MKKHKSLVLIKVAIFNISSNCVNASFAVKPFSYFLIADKPSGYDRVRNVEIGNKDFELDVLDEAYTTEHWIVRIYKVGSAWPGLSVYLVLYVSKEHFGEVSASTKCGSYHFGFFSVCMHIYIWCRKYFMVEHLCVQNFLELFILLAKFHHMQGHRREKLFPSLQQQSHCDV